MVLNSKAIKNLIEEKELIKDYLDLDKQLQPSGFDLSLKEVKIFRDKGSVDFSNKERVIADTESLLPDEDDWWELKKGCYTVIYNEMVNMPLNLVALARPRSTLLRNAATVETAVWDPGYRGRSSSLLLVYNRHGIRLKKNARVVQLVFFPTQTVDTGYTGIYQNERV